MPPHEYFDIYSPLSEVLYNCYNLYLRIPLYSIKKYNLLNDYISFMKNKQCKELLVHFYEREEIKLL